MPKRTENIAVQSPEHANSSANVILLFLADADEINRLYKYEPAPGRINKYLHLKIGLGIRYAVLRSFSP